MEEDTPTGQDIPWTLGDRLYKSRCLAGYKYRAVEFAELVDISDNSRRKYEDDVIVPRRHVLVAWSLVTGMSVDWLLTGQSPDTSSFPSSPDNDRYSPSASPSPLKTRRRGRVPALA